MSGTRKRWISAEVDGRLIAQVEREAEARGISRSEAIRRALCRWASEAMEEDEERITKAQTNHRQIMNRLEVIVGMIQQDRRVEQVGGRGPGPKVEPKEASEHGPLAEARKRARRGVR